MCGSICRNEAIFLVAPEDFAFWDLPDRKVLKIHGSIHSLGSILATRSDYAAHEQLHSKFDITANPQVIYCAMYQDGLMHALERIADMKRTGEYSHRCRVIDKICSYERIRKERVAERRHPDVAYIDGYSNGMLYLLLDDRDRKALPLFYVYGNRDQPTRLPRYRQALRAAGLGRLGALRLAKEIVTKRLGVGDELHHTPFL